MLSFSQIALAICSAVLVGVVGVLPAYLFSRSDKALISLTTLNRWLSFATGSLIGDVFLHLVPETLNTFEDNSVKTVTWGSSIIAGIIVFYFVEKLAFINSEDTFIKSEKPQKRIKKKNNMNGPSNNSLNLQGSGIIGYLNLAANTIDNFCHGMSIGASFLISIQCGLLTTSCILIHEIPHEISDFFILLRSGFSRLEAAKAQFLTALTCLLGTLATLVLNWKGAYWKGILPFTAGGFLYIGLVSLLPNILREKCTKESLIQLGILFVGVNSMHVLACVHK